MVLQIKRITVEFMVKMIFKEQPRNVHSLHDTLYLIIFYLKIVVLFLTVIGNVRVLVMVLF